MYKTIQSIVLASAAVFLLSCQKEDPSNSAQQTQPDGDQATNSYPLETCVVTGKKLGSMGEPHVIIHEGQQVKFCCEGCVPRFEKNPEKFVSKLSN